MTSSRTNKTIRTAKPRAAKARPAKGSTLRVKAPWPDQSARREMSQTEAECENLGKHSKNREWVKRW